MEITIIIVDTLIVLCILFMLATVVDIVKNVLREHKEVRHAESSL